MANLMALAVAPVLIGLFYIFIRDKYEKEPWGLLIIGLFYGALSIFPIMQIEIFITSFMPHLSSFGEALYTAFLVAALTEQALRFVILYFLVWINKEFNEPMDGIVYAVFISLGFAGVENVLYVFNPSLGGIETALMRAIISVPAHGLFGIIMGYHFAMAKFENNKKYLLGAFLIPWGIHGLYDAIVLSGHRLYLLALSPLIIWLWISGLRKIKLYLDISPFKRLDK